MLKLNCTQECSVLDALLILSPNSSKTTLRNWIKTGRVTIDDIPAKTLNDVVNNGQSVVLGERPKPSIAGAKIVYEDQHMVVVDKPSGMLSVATDFDKTHTMHAYIKEKYHPRVVYVVHRLDQETSGIMLFALSEQARDAFKAMFEAHDLQRKYVAIVEGQLPKPAGTWQCYLHEDENYYVHASDSSKNGKLATTHYLVEKVSKRYSWLELQLETGRKNQIRVHCRRAGVPVVGDVKYGAKTNPIKRLALHARLLAFNHPITAKPMHFESPVPHSFTRLF